MRVEWLLKLYPTGWRQRYGDEFADLLRERGVSIGDVVDIIAGAMDAHLHFADGPNRHYRSTPRAHRPSWLVKMIWLALSAVFLVGATAIASYVQYGFELALVLTSLVIGTLVTAVQIALLVYGLRTLRELANYETNGNDR